MIKFGIALNISSEENRPDKDVISEFYKIGDLAEKLNFYSLFVFEHHFSNYLLSPAPLQTLSYFAGRTQKIKLGTSVIVLPWHHPIEIAEQISLLEILSLGRGIYCFGKGRSKIEYDGFGIPIYESKSRFIEAVEIIRGLFSCETFSYNGEFNSFSSISIRPKILSNLQNHFYGSASSIESIKLMAELGLGLITTCDKDWDKIKIDIELHKRYSSSNCQTVQHPILFALISIDEIRERAFERAYKYINNDLKLTTKHYNHGIVPHLTEFDIKKQIIGTASDCIEQILALSSLTSSNHIVFEFSYGGMPYAETVKCVKLFASKVMNLLNNT
jgi:alkanesulfonate monooxygenase SsuD/methylene tetrahydromethanopterin reductase-like flavin-dependent oxidoreductase (luciferase family)